MVERNIVYAIANKIHDFVRVVELLTSRLQTTNSVANIAQQVSVAQIKQIAHNEKATLVQYSIIYDEFKVQGK